MIKKYIVILKKILLTNNVKYIHNNTTMYTWKKEDNKDHYHNSSIKGEED